MAPSAIVNDRYASFVVNVKNSDTLIAELRGINAQLRTALRQIIELRNDSTERGRVFTLAQNGVRGRLTSGTSTHRKCNVYPILSILREKDRGRLGN